MSLPELGKISYYRSWEAFPNLILQDEMFAIANNNGKSFLLITKQNQKNITADQAGRLASMSDLIKTGVLEAAKKTLGILETVLFEAESAILPSQTDPVEMQDVSLDQKVDRYLVRYEKEAIPASDDYAVDGAVQQRINTADNPKGVALGNGQPVQVESKKRTGLLEAVLFEAPGDPPPDAGGDLAAGFGGDLGGGDAGGLGDLGGSDDSGAPAAPPSPPVIDTPKMNMNNYTRAVARLINNYESLLDPKTTILNRAKEYIRVNYDEATATMFEQVMEKQFGITKTVERRDQRQAPGAVGAIYSSGGGGG